jgi:hypothetical protein
MMRSGLSDEEVAGFIESAVLSRDKDGWEAEARNHERQSFYSSMATIGG